MTEGVQLERHPVEAAPGRWSRWGAGGAEGVGGAGGLWRCVGGAGGLESVRGAGGIRLGSFPMFPSRKANSALVSSYAHALPSAKPFPGHVRRSRGLKNPLQRESSPHSAVPALAYTQQPAQYASRSPRGGRGARGRGSAGFAGFVGFHQHLHHPQHHV